jgi:putative membrane protein
MSFPTWNNALVDRLGPSTGGRTVRKFALAAAAILLATSAWAQSTTEKTGVNSMLGVAPSTEDFVKEAATSDMFEIESSKLALERSDEATKAFAQQMIQDHEKTTADLKGLVTSGKVQATLPAAMTDAQAKMLNDLKSMKSDEFTEKYHSEQVDAHEDAVDLFKRYGDEGEQADLKAWAAKTLPTLQHHLEMAKQLNK